MSHQNGDEHQVGGKLLACPICGQAHFQSNQTLMSTKGANFLGLDWTNPNADTYTCTQCGYILWFLPGNTEGEEFDVHGQRLACTFCNHTSFSRRETLMSTRGATFMKMDWTNPKADNYICANCAHVLWFMQTIDNKAGHECEIAGYKLSCQMCHNTHFWTRETLMSGKGATFMGMDWAERTAVNYLCSQCAHILWFARD